MISNGVGIPWKWCQNRQVGGNGDDGQHSLCWGSCVKRSTTLEGGKKAQLSGLSDRTVRWIIHDHLGINKIGARWVPKHLSARSFLELCGETKPARRVEDNCHRGWNHGSLLYSLCKSELEMDQECLGSVSRQKRWWLRPGSCKITFLRRYWNSVMHAI